MKALLFKKKQQPLIMQERTKPKPIQDEVLIKIYSAALNHTEVWFMKEHPKQYEQGLVLGADGCGIIEEVGPTADPKLKGLAVVINPSIDWGASPIVPSTSFSILGAFQAGTFSEYMAISQKKVYKKPDHLSFSESSAVPLSGLTSYRALFSKAKLKENEKVLITGIGGGTALWALQLALAQKAKVYVTSGSDEKIQKAIALGAILGFNYKNSKWMDDADRETGGFDVIIDGAGGAQLNALLHLSVAGGRIVCYGRTAGNIAELTMRDLFWKQLSIYGTSMGTDDEFVSMLKFISTHKIKPIIDAVYPFEKHEEAFNHLRTSDQFGKIVMEISPAPFDIG